MANEAQSGTLIRPFEPVDADAVIKLALGIQQLEFGLAITAEDQPDLVDVRTYYQLGRGNFWVAVDGDDIVGTVGLLDVGGRRGVLRKMFVATTHRGIGVAASLLETCLSHARSVRMTEIMLGTTAKMIAAHRFYERWGFVEVNPDDLPPLFPRMKVDTKFYRRGL